MSLASENKLWSGLYGGIGLLLILHRSLGKGRGLNSNHVLYVGSINQDLKIVCLSLVQSGNI